MPQSTERGPRGARVKPGGAAPRRADAERNITAILDAALLCLSHGTDATMTDIAKAAGVGRVTLYGHFNSREAILDALLARSIGEADATFAQLDLESGPAADAVVRLLGAPWLLGRYRGLYAAATRDLGPQKVRQLHDQVFGRIERLIARGRDEGAFRTDLPLDWLIASVYALAHAAITEIDQDRVTSERGAHLLTVTILDLLKADDARR
ncbi:MAG: TetR/AcrR family transcriptional regulator [Actinocrinis sp.]